MNDSILTLPGDIPGLLRRGSPVLYRDEESWWTVLYVDDDEACASPGDEAVIGLWGMLDDFALDLSDPTGRAHAAWWVLGQSAGPVSKALAALDTSSTYLLGLIDRCCAGSATAFDTEALRRIVLHVAGREGSDV